MKKKGLSAAKAKQILKDGYVKGKLLTEKQKKFFGSIADGATPLKKINGGSLDKYQDGGNTKSKSFYNLVLDKALKDKKGTLAQWNRLKDIIAYHESKSDPTAVQTGGGPGRGLYQFEPNSLKTAGQRAINYGKINNIEVPSYIIDISKGKLKDASKLTEEQQNELLLIDYLQKPNADLGKYFSGEQSEVDFWLKGHWGGEKAQGAEAAEKRRKSFIRDLKQYNKLYPEIENKGVIEDEQFKNGGWLDKYNDGGSVQPNYNDSNVSLPPGFKGWGYNTKGDNYNPAWNGPVTRMGGTIPGATGMMYARTSGLEPLEPIKAQDGNVVFDKEDITPERIEQGRQRVLDYYSSPGYLKLLRNSYENPEQEQLERINNVKNTKVLDVGDINAYTPETHSVRFMPNYYKDLTEHEFLHAGTRGPERISEDEKYIISMNVTDPDRQKYFDIGEDPYIEIPEEYQARLGIARMLMQHNNMFDYNTETFTQEHLDKIKKDMKENPKRWNIKGFQDVMKSRESDDALIEVMNTIAQNTQNTQSNYLAKYGKVIEDDRGQWAHPGKITKINSNNITMKGVNYPVLGISDTGDTKMMQPGKDYKFKGNSVTEYPMAQNGKTITVNSKEDPRYQAYQDSLAIYNSNQKLVANLKKEGYDKLSSYQPREDDPRYQAYQDRLEQTMQDYADEADGVYTYTTPASIIEAAKPRKKGRLYEVDDLIPGLINEDLGKQLFSPKIMPKNETVWSENILGMGFGDKRATFDYSNVKPNQEVIYQPDIKYDTTRFMEPPPLRKPIPRKKVKNITNLIKKDFVQPKIETGDIYLPIPDYYNVTKEVNQNLGSHKKTFRVRDEAELERLKRQQEIDEQTTTGKNNRLIITPNYDSGRMRKINTSAKNGGLVALNQLTNFTNYNTPQPGGWLDKY